MSAYPPTWPGCVYKRTGVLVELTGFIAPEGVYADYALEEHRRHRAEVRPDIPGWIWNWAELKPLTPIARKMLAIARRNKRVKKDSQR